MATIKPPYMLQRYENVPNLISLYKEGRLGLPELMKGFVAHVIWDHRGINGQPDWSAENTWGTVWAAYREGVFTPAEYLYITSEYEQQLSKAENS